MSFIEDLWGMEFRLFPIALSLLLFELPAIVRRQKKLLYVPIYFSVFPLRELNKSLSTYLVEDDFYDDGWRLKDEDAERLRKKIIAISVASMAISALLTPLIVGFLVAFYADRITFFQFLGVLVLWKVLTLIKSIMDFHYHAVGSVRNRSLLVVVYFCYLGVVFEVLRQSYSWSRPFIEKEAWLELSSSLSSLIFGRIVVEFVILALLTAVFVSLVADREVRRRAIDPD